MEIPEKFFEPEDWPLWMRKFTDYWAFKQAAVA